ncbi:unnamed protein product [Phytophthora fragariaefolia]|uniref:Unnamed protein product n=1 Tax=Phytophthora fragariaefolia TaxID=1490495 RepID=A0A9W6U826_9STRA|nr:unnamed protein product [Phytophthora fragariaefolia]
MSSTTTRCPRCTTRRQIRRLKPYTLSISLVNTDFDDHGDASKLLDSYMQTKIHHELATASRATSRRVSAGHRQVVTAVATAVRHAHVAQHAEQHHPQLGHLLEPAHGIMPEFHGGHHVPVHKRRPGGPAAILRAGIPGIHVDGRAVILHRAERRIRSNERQQLSECVGPRVQQFSGDAAAHLQDRRHDHIAGVVAGGSERVRVLPAAAVPIAGSIGVHDTYDLVY